MYRSMLTASVALVLALLAPLAPADNAPPREVAALQDAMQAAIHDAEPAIACILVSRSDEYIKLGETPAPDGSGRLGRFSLTRAQAMSPVTDDNENARLKKLDLSDQANVPESYGSGVVIDETGLILTNEHVVRNATKIYVRLPGSEKGYYADVHAADPRSDLAVLRLLVDRPTKFKAIKLGDGGKARKGQFIITLANPFAAGFRDGSPSASWGIISNVRQCPAGSTDERERVKPLHQHGSLLQTDARLNVGCSGGALIDLKGELIGLTTALAAISGTEAAGGYAIPIDNGMKRVIEVLKRGEEVEYGFLGVQLSQQPLRTEKGIEIKGTVLASPAAKKGLQDRDIIVAINGTPIKDYNDLFLTVSTILAGNDAKLEVIRRPNSTPQTITVTLDKFAAPVGFIASRKPAAVRGLRVDYLSVYMQGLHASAQPQDVAHGVIVREVQPSTPAATALLKANDIITHVKGQPVTSPQDFYQKMQKLTGPVEITLAGPHRIILN